VDTIKNYYNSRANKKLIHFFLTRTKSLLDQAYWEGYTTLKGKNCVIVYLVPIDQCNRNKDGFYVTQVAIAHQLE